MPRPAWSGAHKLAPIYRQTLDLRAKVDSSNLDAEAKAGLVLELDAKIDQFQSALKDLLGLDLIAFSTMRPAAPRRLPRRPRRRNSAQRLSRRGVPRPRPCRAGHGRNSPGKGLARKPERRRLEERIYPPARSSPQRPSPTAIFHVQVAENAAPTAPFFTRPSIEQPYYDISNPAWRDRSFAPWPLAAWAEFTFDGLPIRIGQVVQTLQRVTGPGGIYEPLVVTPAIGVRIEPEARILPLDGSALPVQVTVHTQAAAEGTVDAQAARGLARRPGRGAVPSHQRRRH